MRRLVLVIVSIAVIIISPVRADGSVLNYLKDTGRDLVITNRILRGDSITVRQEEYPYDIGRTMIKASKGIGGERVISLGVDRFKVGGIEGRDESGQKIGEFVSEDTIVMVGYERRISRSRIGIGIKYITSSISEYESRGYAFDLRYGYEIKARKALATLYIDNISRGIKYYDRYERLPTAIGMLISYNILGLWIDTRIKRYLYEKKNEVYISSEYGIGRLFYVTGGMRLMGESEEINRGIDFGVGIRSRGYSLEYIKKDFIGEERNEIRIGINF